MSLEETQAMQDRIDRVLKVYEDKLDNDEGVVRNNVEWLVEELARLCSPEQAEQMETRLKKIRHDNRVKKWDESFLKSIAGEPNTPTTYEDYRYGKSTQVRSQPKSMVVAPQNLAAAQSLLSTSASTIQPTWDASVSVNLNQEALEDVVKRIAKEQGYIK